MFRQDKKIVINEGRQITNGSVSYGGFPKILNEGRHSSPLGAEGRDDGSPSHRGPERERDLADIDNTELLDILTRGGHPLMAGQTVSGKRGVPAHIRSKAIEHLKKLSGGTPEEGEEALEFLRTHFPDFTGIE